MSRPAGGRCAGAHLVAHLGQRYRAIAAARSAGRSARRRARRRHGPALSRRGTGQYRGPRPMEPVIHLRDAVVVLGRFPALAGASLRGRAGRDRAAAGPERRRQDHAPAGVRRARARGARRGHRARVGPGRATAAPCAPRWACSGHGNGLYDDLTVGRERALLGPHRGREPRPRSTAAMARLGLAGRLADTAVGPPLGRPAPPGGAGRAGGPPAGAVAARRAPRRPRRRGPRPGGRAAAHRGRGGRHRPGGLPRAGPRRGAGRATRCWWTAAGCSSGPRRR